MLLSREIMVLTNAIAFNFLLCLFPLLLVLVAAAQRLAPGGATATAVRLLLSELIPVGPDTLASSLRQMTKLDPASRRCRSRSWSGAPRASSYPWSGC
jgi:uncharacterized BrkB/YihY/UPF0761 family membrane protein